MATALTRRERIKRKYQTYSTILILTNQLGKGERTAVDRTLESIDRASARQLRAVEKELDYVLNEAVHRYGVIASRAELEKLLAEGRTGLHPGERSYFCLSKQELCRAFRHYENALPVFPKLPPHARIGIDLNSIRDSTKEMEVFQLGAFLFEDLASLWNEATRVCSAAERTDSSKTEVKLAASLLRAAAKAAFNLLEGYLNGLACDILTLRTVTADERERLEEWNVARNRPRFLSLRDKLLQYPKIAIGAPHPPICEETFPSMARIIELEAEVRHALIHPRPQVDGSGPNMPKEIVFFSLPKQRVATLCDDVLEVIQGVADVVGPDYGEVTLWLYREIQMTSFRNPRSTETREITPSPGTRHRSGCVAGRRTALPPESTNRRCPFACALAWVDL